MTDRKLQANPEVPAEVNGLRIPDQLEVTHGIGIGTLATAMGIRLIELAPDRAVAVMPTEGNEQSYGLMHGGAFVVLGESLGSMASCLHAVELFGQGAFAVGVDVNATHTRGVASGWVTAECTALHLGRTLAVHEIAITDADGRRCSTVRITNAVRAPKGA
ncbi:PaaI family thioesterase [Gulosibacter bifidus]|uniref:PaaI family thioesterase n=1 Tax=Gulosibacter bifidus TaxID=272239 RepID=A0ABW5RGH7_9MICO